MLVTVAYTAMSRPWMTFACRLHSLTVCGSPVALTPLRCLTRAPTIGMSRCCQRQRRHTASCALSTGGLPRFHRTPAASTMRRYSRPLLMRMVAITMTMAHLRQKLAHPQSPAVCRHATAVRAHLPECRWPPLLCARVVKNRCRSACCHHSRRAHRLRAGCCCRAHRLRAGCCR